MKFSIQGFLTPSFLTEWKFLLLMFSKGFLEIFLMKISWDTQRSKTLVWQGDREPLLDSFCEYQEQINPRADSEPAHWDVALLVSGLNFYAVDSRGRKVTVADWLTNF